MDRLHGPNSIARVGLVSSCCECDHHRTSEDTNHRVNTDTQANISAMQLTLRRRPSIHLKHDITMGFLQEEGQVSIAHMTSARGTKYHDHAVGAAVASTFFNSHGLGLMCGMKKGITQVQRIDTRRSDRPK